MYMHHMHGLQQGFDDSWAGTAILTSDTALSVDNPRVGLLHLQHHNICGMCLLGWLATTTAVLVNEMKQACPKFASGACVYNMPCGTPYTIQVTIQRVVIMSLK